MGIHVERWRYIAGCMAFAMLSVPTGHAVQAQVSVVSPELAGMTHIRLAIRLDAQSADVVPVDTAALMQLITTKLQRAGWRTASDDTSADSVMDWPIFQLLILVGQYRPNPTTAVYLIRYDYGIFDKVRRVDGPVGAPVLARIWTGRTTSTDLEKDIHAVNGAIQRTVSGILDRLNAARGPFGRRA